MADNTFEAGYNAAVEDVINFFLEEAERISATRFPSEDILNYIEGVIAHAEGGHF